MSTKQTNDSARRLQLLGRLTFSAGLLVAATVFLRPAAPDQRQSTVDSNTSSGERLVSLSKRSRSAVPDHATKPIEQINVGQRVLAHNPEVTDEERSGWVEPDWSDWLHLSLVMPKEDGSELEIELLRSEDWVRSQLNFVVDEKEDAALVDAPPVAPTIQLGEPTLSVPLSPLRSIFRDLAMTDLVIEEAGLELVGLAAEMDLPELAITGPAAIVDLQPAPLVSPGQGHVVTATFHHTSGDVIDLTIGDATSADTIGTTSNHPFWSEDRQEYVQAGTLQIGEKVRTYAGDTKQVVSLLPRPGPEAVFNMEVHGEHVYFVNRAGILVHNAHSTYIQRLDQTPISKGSWKGKRGQGKFTSSRPEFDGVSVEYRNGFADLTPFAKHTVKIDHHEFLDIVRQVAKKASDNVGDPRARLHRIADTALATRLGVKPSVIKKFRKGRFTWHEAEDMSTLQLVPMKVNSKFGHLGGVAEAQRKLGVK